MSEKKYSLIDVFEMANFTYEISLNAVSEASEAESAKNRNQISVEETLARVIFSALEKQRKSGEECNIVQRSKDYRVIFEDVMVKAGLDIDKLRIYMTAYYHLYLARAGRSISDSLYQLAGIWE